MATGKVTYEKIPFGDPGTPVTAAMLDRIQQRIQDMAQKIPVPAAPNVVTINGDYTVKGTEDILHVTSQLAPVKITLLQPSSSNRPITIKQVDLQGSKTQVNPVTIVTPDQSNTIAGKSSITLDDTGTGSVSITADNQQHWPSTSSGGNPPVAPAGSGLVYFGIPPIYVAGNQIGINLPPAPPPAPVVTPWIAPIPYGTDNTFISNTLGTETWGAECMVDFTAAPLSLTAWWWFQSQDGGSNGTINIRVGGSANKALDGVIVATLHEVSATIASHSLAVVFSTPGGSQPLRVTLSTKSTAGQKCIISGVNLQFR